MVKEIKEGFKQTEVGIIPDDWEVKQLGKIAHVMRGKFTPRPRNDPKFYGGNIPFVQTGDIAYSKGIILNYSQTLNKYGLEVSKLFKKGTVLMTIAANIGYTGVLAIDMACPDSVAAIDGLKGYDNNFLNCYFTFKQKELENLSTPGAQKNLNIEVISKIKIPIPPTELEQTAIANALNNLNGLIIQFEKLIAKKKSVKLGVMQELLKPKDGWIVKKIGEVFKFLRTANNSRADLIQEGNIEYIHYGDIHTKWNAFLDCSKEILPFIEEYKVKGVPLLQDGDLVIADASEDYESLGVCIEITNIGKRKIVAGLHTLLLRGNKELIIDGFKGYFRKYHTVKEALIAASTGVSVYGISKSKLKEIRILIPTIEEQKQIAKILSDMDAEIENLEKKIDKYKLLKQGMMQNLLTGKIRLI